MDRQIKYRYYDEYTKKMYMVKTMDWGGRWESLSLCHIYLDTDEPYMNQEIIAHSDDVMQYTWLKDSKGVDIYENDITNNGVVKRFDWLSRDSWGSIHPWWYFDLWYNSEYQELYYTIWFDDVIVLWNIYENPDLLPKPTDG